MSSAIASGTVKKFRVKQLLRLESHIRRLGPLTAETTPKREPNSQTIVLPNPFLPRKNPQTGKWRPPVYSLRQQAELVKKAKTSGMLHLLPPGPKTPQTRLGVTEAIKEVQAPASATSSDDQRTDEDKVWQQPVAWEGKWKAKEVRGANLGIKLYAGKKRMFKGHKWERVLQDRLKTRQALMRGMKKRISSYKNYYKRRKPNPLRPPRTLKSPKLPF